MIGYYIREQKPSWRLFFDRKDFPNGFLYFNNINTIYKNYKPIIVHNNWIKGLDNKIKSDQFWHLED